MKASLNLQAYVERTKDFLNKTFKYLLCFYNALRGLEASLNALTYIYLSDLPPSEGKR